MATLLTAKAAATVQAKGSLAITSVTGIYTLIAALALNDIIQMVKVPKGATIQEIILSTTDLDGATPALVLSVGDGNDTARFIAANTGGQAGGLIRMDKHAGHGYQYANTDTIDVKVTTGPGTTPATTGTITLTAVYSMDA